MKIIDDMTLIEAELRQRKAWDGFTDGATPNRTVIFEKNIFYRQHGYDCPGMNYAVWLQYGEDEGADFQQAVSFFLRRPFESEPQCSAVRDGNHRTSTVKTVKRCPRCGGPIPNAEHAGLYPGAVSYLDAETEICGPCGTDEGLSWPNDPWKEESWAKEQRARWLRK